MRMYFFGEIELLYQDIVVINKACLVYLYYRKERENIIKKEA